MAADLRIFDPQQLWRKQVVDNVTSIQADVSTLQSDVTTLQSDVTTLQADVTALQASAVLQVVSSETGAVATGTTILPADNTIPQATEGDQYMSLAITPKNAGSTLVIDVVAVVSPSSAQTVSAALFQDATANALAAVFSTVSSPGGATILAFRHIMTAGTTSATTFKVRAGPQVSSTLTFNGAASGRIFGGVMSSSIVITEYA